MNDRLRVLLTVVPFSLFLPISAGAAMPDRPPGDTCDFPVVLLWGQDWSYDGDLTLFADDYDPAVPGPSCTGYPAPGRDMVFAMSLNCIMGLELSMQPDNFDGAIYIVTDCYDIAGSCVAASDHGGIGATESLSLAPTGYQTYYIVVDARDPGTGGPFALTLGFFSSDVLDGACCFSDGHCSMIEFYPCAMAGGTTLGPCTDCDPNPCPPTPLLPERWGAIKARFRSED
jgi:hypothetical protein